jgi:DNA-binding MarR family transcriptional regulator
MKRKVVKAEVTRFLDAWFAVRQFIQAANFNRFQGAGLSATQFMTLNLLPSDGDGIAIGELARRMNLKPATVAKTVDSLEARKMVTRMRDAPDKRVVMIKATKMGLELQNAASGHFHAQIETIFKAMLPAERDGLIVGLESVIRSATRESGSRADKTTRGTNAVPRA